MSFFRSTLKYRDLLFNLVSRDLKSRYRGSFLGVLWTVLTPLFMALIYFLFLFYLFKAEVRPEELIIGVFAWQFTVQSIQAGMNSITGNSNLVKKIYFPRIIIPLSTTLSALVNYLLMLVVQFFLLAMLLDWPQHHVSLLTIPGILFVISFHFVFNLALALITAAANVYFRDTQHLVGLFLSAWFFVSPVMYSMSLVKTMTEKHPWVSDLYLLNPLAILITAYRSLQIGEVFQWSSPSVLAGIFLSLLLFAGSLVFFKRSERYFADWL